MMIMAAHLHDWDKTRTNMNAQPDVHVVKKHRVGVSDVSLLPEGLRSHELVWYVPSLYGNMGSAAPRTVVYRSLRSGAARATVRYDLHLKLASQHVEKMDLNEPV
jgi:hypothetical protein